MGGVAELKYKPMNTNETLTKNIIDFPEFPKIPRLSREMLITEKIDGTNGVIHITTSGEMLVGSRSRWITPQNDNFGFAKWAEGNRDELIKLGPGTHYGEWWGQGIQRSYAMGAKVFSLFNTSKWSDDSVRPSCCRVVPILWSGIFDTSYIQHALDVLRLSGSKASPGFMNPEGVIIYHVSGNIYFKKTLERDEEFKGNRKHNDK